MSIAAIGRTLAIAAVLVAAPAIADNTQWAPYPRDALDLCQRETRDPLELRACLSRRLLAAENAFNLATERLQIIVESETNLEKRQAMTQALGYARETWRSHLEFQCQFEGVMLGDSLTQLGQQTTACQIALYESQAHRLRSLALELDPDGDFGVPGGGFSQRFGDWEAMCSPGLGCLAETYSGRSQDYHLVVLYNEFSREYIASLIGYRNPVDLRQEVYIRVDNRRIGSYRHLRAYEDQMGEGVFVIAAGDSRDRLISAMRRGGEIEIEYVATNGRSYRPEFSLSGVTAALNWIAESRVSGAPYNPYNR